MAGPTLTFPEETMRELIGAAILKGIDTEARNALIQSAINHMIAPTKTKGMYGREEAGPSPIEEAFMQAVNFAARQYVQEWVTSSDEGQAAMRGQLEQLLAAYRSKLDDDWQFKQALNEWVIDYFSKKSADRY